MYTKTRLLAIFFRKKRGLAIPLCGEGVPPLRHAGILPAATEGQGKETSFLQKPLRGGISILCRRMMRL